MKRLLLILLLSVTAFQGFSQTKGISYQAVILNPSPQEIPGANAQGNILANSAVSIEFSIINSSGTEEYQEQHSTRTDRYGMINLLIGTGTPAGSKDFSDIFWDGTVKKLKVAIDFKGGSNFSPLSEQNLTYMPQPPTQETTIEIAGNTAAIATERTRAINAEQANATGISTLKTEQTLQNNAIALNTAKVGVTPQQASTIGNTTGINTGDQDISGIAINAGAITTLQGEQTTQNTVIALNTAKTGITTAQAGEISANTLKTGITTQQTSDITANNAKVGITTQQASDITTNNAKVGITSQQASDITINNAKVGITTLQADAIVANTTKTGITTAQATAIAANTSKTGITSQQASDITTNNAKVGITTQQASDITANNAKVSDINHVAASTTSDLAEGTNLYYTEARVSANTNVVANTVKTGITTQQATDITANNAKVGITSQQASDITTNNAKVGITTQQASNITANNAKVSDINHVATSTTSDLAEGTNLYYTEARVSANTNVAANTLKTGITPAQTTAITANTAHISLTNNPHTVTKTQIGLGNVENSKVNLAGTVEPTIDDDSTSGYSVGSRWIDVTNAKEYVCVDATATAAVWVETTGGSSTNYAGTSTTSINLSTFGPCTTYPSYGCASGTATLTTTVPLSYTAGMRVRISETSNPTMIFIEGVIQSYDGITMIITVDTVISTSPGPFSNWTINLGAGLPGVPGLVGERGEGYGGTSATSNDVSLGAKDFTIYGNYAYNIGMRVRFSNSATDYVEGIVTSYDTFTSVLTLTADHILGAGTFTDWTVGIAGDPATVGSENLGEVLILGNDANGNNIVNTGKIGIGTATPNAQSSMEIATALPVIFPSMTQTQVNAITVPVEGMVQFNSDAHKLQVYAMLTDNAEILNEIYIGNESGPGGFVVDQSFTSPIDGQVIAVELMFKDANGGFPEIDFMGQGNYTVPSYSQFTWHTFILTSPMPVTAGVSANFGFIGPGVDSRSFATNSNYPNGSISCCLMTPDNDVLFRVHIQPVAGSFGWQNMH